MNAYNKNQGRWVDEREDIREMQSKGQWVEVDERKEGEETKKVRRLEPIVEQAIQPKEDYKNETYFTKH